MATVTFTRHTITCDGCGTLFPADLGAASLTEVRAAAYVAGWRFPPQVNRKSGNAATATSDACPVCIPAWQPRPAGKDKSRVLTAAEAAVFVPQLLAAVKGVTG